MESLELMHGYVVGGQKGETLTFGLTRSLGSSEPEWSSMSFFIGCDPAATSKDTLLQGSKAESDW